VFNVIDEGKSHDYNPDFNNINLFNKPNLLRDFIKYSIQDSIALLNCIIKAQIHYIDKYQVDIGGVFYPTGKWVGIYFSELLKLAVDNGYTIKLIKGYDFYDEILFKDYVEHFYELKRNSYGSTRWIAKMHLNQLYGYFGRSLDLIQTENVN
jgi:hypothetical protein